MSMILLAVEDAVRDAPVRDLLTAEGWWVTTVGSREEALRAAADHAPQLLIVDSGLAAPAIMQAFGRHEGGPGVLVLVDHAGDAVSDGGDGVVGRDQDPAELLAIVRRSLEAPRPAGDHPVAAPEATSEDEQLTSRDLFGDILQVLGEEGLSGAAAGAPPSSAEEPESSAPPEKPATPPDSETEPETEAEAAEEEAAESTEEAEPEIGAEAAEVEAEPAESAEAEEEPEEEVEVEASEAETPEPEPAEPEIPEPEIVEPEIVELEPAAPEVAEPEPVELEIVELEPAEPEIAESEIAEPETPEAPEEPEIAAEAPEPEEHDRAIDQAPDESRLVEPVLDDELSSLPPEPGTDIEAQVAELLEAQDLEWRDPALETGEIERLSIDDILAVGDAGVDGGGAEAEAGEPLVDDDLETLGPYKLIEMLEFGDLTERWLAFRADGDGSKVVLERIRHELQSRADVRQAFVDGYSEAAGWDQDNILRVVDLGRDGDVDYVATQYHPGRSLREVLSRVRRMEARMPLGISLLIAERIVEGLRALAAGPVGSRHGWLGPGSIWLSDDGEVLLREFGFGRLEPGEDVNPLDWKEHRFAGPEVWSGKADLRADLYSLGALLYEMICGHTVHEAEDTESLLERIQKEDIEPAQKVDPTIPSEVDGWIMRLLRRNPMERPQAVEEIASKVDLALQSLPVRPADAELSAYLRQLFAARVPEGLADHPSPSSQVREPAEPGGTGEGEEAPSAGSFGGRPWYWWLLVTLLAFLVTFVAWRWAAAEEPASVSYRRSEAGWVCRHPPADTSRSPA